MRDVDELDVLAPEPGAFCIMDHVMVRGCIESCAELQPCLQARESFFVTGAKSHLDAGPIYPVPTDADASMICDQSFARNGSNIAMDYPEQLRRFRINVPESGETLDFPTSTTVLPAPTFAALYQKNRRQMELFNHKRPDLRWPWVGANRTEEEFPYLAELQQPVSNRRADRISCCISMIAGCMFENVTDP